MQRAAVTHGPAGAIFESMLADSLAVDLTRINCTCFEVPRAMASRSGLP
jgi:hypothetical protein